jgi:hypothetical protein
METRGAENALGGERLLSSAVFVLGTVFLGLILTLATAHAEVQDWEALRQFTAGGHVLGFGESSLYVASTDHLVKVDLVGARPVAPVVDAEAAAGEGGAPGMVQPLKRVTYPEPWAGVTLVYEGHSGGLVKSTYRVQPGAKGKPVEQIRLAYNRPVRLDARGNLVIGCETGEMVEQAPVAWQEVAGERKPIPVSYLILGEKEIGFRVADYDPALPLVIDPAMTWNTFLGGGGSQHGFAIAADSSGNVYVAGESSGSWESPVRPYTANNDAFAAKLGSDGSLIWNTFLGGSGFDRGTGIAVDGSGNIYVAGYSDAAWGSPVSEYTAGFDLFAAKLGSDGSLIWNTFLGGSDTDFGTGIAVDGSDNVFVTGSSAGTWGAPVSAHAAGGSDAFAAKLQSDGSLAWNTFLGGGGYDSGYAITLDGSNNVYVAGASSSSWGTPARAYTAGTDGFVAKLQSDGSLAWNTFLGGGGYDSGYAITLDGSNNIYVAGASSSSWGTPARAYTAGTDGFVAKLGGSGSLTWNTFLGSGGQDYAYGIAVDGSDNVHVAGTSEAAWGLPGRAFTTGSDAFAARLASDGSLIWNTFLGGEGSDYGSGIALDEGGNVYVTGGSEATWGAPVRVHGASKDAFVAQLPEMPTFATVNSFGTTPKADRIILTWKTSAEMNCVGFNVWRADAPGSDYDRVNAALIPARGTMLEGASYSYVDFSVTRDTIYSYKLEDIDDAGASSFHEPLTAFTLGKITLVFPANGAKWSHLSKVPFDWKSFPYNRFNLEFSTTASFSHKLVFPHQCEERYWITKSSYLPTEHQRYRVKRLAGKAGTVYWRVYGVRDNYGFTSKPRKLKVF